MYDEMDVTIIIVNYLTYDLTLNVMKSVQKHTDGIKYEIIVVDNSSNSSNDTTLSHFIENSNDDIELILSDENIGFSKANNLAIKQAQGKYILLLNSDCELTENTIKKSFNYLENYNHVGVVGTRLITTEGVLDSGCRRGFPTPFASLCYFLGIHKISKNPKFDQYKLFHLDEFEIAEVDAVSGAFLFAPKSLLMKIDFFDDRFFLYGEDLDLCYRIKQLGYKVIYNPNLGNVIHFRGESGKFRKMKTLFNFHEAMILFYNKHYKSKKNIFVTVIVYIAIGLVYGINAIRSLFRRGDKVVRHR